MASHAYLLCVRARVISVPVAVTKIKLHIVFTRDVYQIADGGSEDSCFVQRRGAHGIGMFGKEVVPEGFEIVVTIEFHRAECRPFGRAFAGSGIDMADWRDFLDMRPANGGLRVVNRGAGFEPGAKKEHLAIDFVETRKWAMLTERHIVVMIAFASA